MARTMRSRAVLRLLSLPNPRETEDPVERALRAEAKDTARMALTIAKGTDLDDVDPVHGYDWSRRAYEDSLRSWQRLAAEEDLSESRDLDRMREARDRWMSIRPAYVRAGDWPCGEVSA